MSALLSLLTRSRNTGYTTAMIKMIPENGIIVCYKHMHAKDLEKQAKKLGRTDIKFMSYQSLDHTRGIDVSKTCIMFDNATLYTMAREMEQNANEAFRLAQELDRAKTVIEAAGLRFTERKDKTPHTYHPGVI